MIISLKTKIILSFIAVILTTSLFSSIVGIRLIDKSIVPRIQDKVRYDLNSAHELFFNEISNVKGLIRLTSTRFFINESLRKHDIRRLNEELENIRKEESLDILNLTDAKGRILVRTNNPELIGDDQSSFPLVASVLKTASPIAAVEIIPRESLLKEGPDLQKRVQYPVIHTTHTESPALTEEISGMFILASSPILDEQNKILGILYGGTLLNNDSTIVDKIKDTMYDRETYEGKNIGAVTLFLHNLRISTNVINSDGQRAIGTPITKEVYNRVVVERKILNKIEFAVNDWYITAYEPIINSTGQAIGILGVGVL